MDPTYSILIVFLTGVAELWLGYSTGSGFKTIILKHRSHHCPGFSYIHSYRGLRRFKPPEQISKVALRIG